jgi:hypothetical protein
MTEMLRKSKAENDRLRGEIERLQDCQKDQAGLLCICKAENDALKAEISEMKWLHPSNQNRQIEALRAQLVAAAQERRCRRAQRAIVAGTGNHRRTKKREIEDLIKQVLRTESNNTVRIVKRLKKKLDKTVGRVELPFCKEGDLELPAIPPVERLVKWTVIESHDPVTVFGPYFDLEILRFEIGDHYFTIWNNADPVSSE